MVNVINNIVTISKRLRQIPASMQVIAAGSLDQVKQSPIVLSKPECGVVFKLLCFSNGY
jgi:hypothetical protein